MAVQLHMWKYWRNTFCDASSTLEAYFSELLEGDSETSQDLRVAMSNIRNARRVREDAIRTSPHNPGPVCDGAMRMARINQKAIDLIMEELVEKAPEED